MPFRAIHEGPKPIDLDESKTAQDRVEANGQVEKVQRQQAQAVDVEYGRVHVVGAQLEGVRLEDPILQIARAKVKEYIDQIKEIRYIVQAKPDRNRTSIDLLEGEAVNYHPKVIEEGHGNNHGPIVAEPPRWIEDEVHFAGGCCGAYALRGSAMRFGMMRRRRWCRWATTSSAVCRLVWMAASSAMRRPGTAP